MRVFRRLATVAATLALFGSFATAASAAAPTPATAAACGNSVVASMPLKNMSTGQASWSYGYVQLWYDSCSGNNWSRVVSLLQGTNWEMTGVYNTADEFRGLRCGSGTILTSPSLYSPVYNAGAWARVFVNGSDAFYEAEANQPGASAGQNIPEWAMCAAV